MQIPAAQLDYTISTSSINMQLAMQSASMHRMLMQSPTPRTIRINTATPLNLAPGALGGCHAAVEK